MQKPQIVFTINEDGSIDTEAIGYTGSACVDDASELYQLLGAEDETKRRLKPAYKQQAKTTQKVEQKQRLS